MDPIGWIIDKGNELTLKRNFKYSKVI
jgi:hypothetical protein